MSKSPQAPENKYDEDFEAINDTPENIARALFGKPIVESGKPEKSGDEG